MGKPIAPCAGKSDDSRINCSVAHTDHVELGADCGRTIYCSLDINKWRGERNLGMNAERLHAIVIALNQEMSQRNVVGKMQELVNALQQVVNQPQNASYQHTLAVSREAMYTAVTATPSDKFSPVWRQILSVIGGDDLFGDKLKENIEIIFARNQITPAVALKELQGLLSKLQTFKDGLDRAVTAFRLFKIGDERLEPGDCEIGVLIPRDAVRNQLLEFADELQDLGKILNTFSEVATGKPDELVIRTISSSDLLVHLQAAPLYAACLATAIERVVALYKQLLEIRKLHAEIKKLGVPDDRISGIEKYAEEIMESGIEKISVEIVNEFHKEKVKGRKNELTNAVRVSLKNIARRIDKGFSLEVRVEPVPEKDQKAENEELQKAIAVIQSAAANMQFLNLEGEPILRLPEGKPEGKKTKRTKKEPHSNQGGEPT